MTTLAENAASAWSRRANEAALLINAARIAPGLFKPDTIEQARRDYFRAIAEVGRWSE